MSLTQAIISWSHANEPHQVNISVDYPVGFCKVPLDLRDLEYRVSVCIKDVLIHNIQRRLKRALTDVLVEVLEAKKIEVSLPTPNGDFDHDLEQYLADDEEDVTLWSLEKPELKRWPSRSFSE